MDPTEDKLRKKDKLASGTEIICQWREPNSEFFKLKSTTEHSKQYDTKINVSNITNLHYKKLIGAYLFVRLELQGTKITKCSLQLLCEITARYLNTSKQTRKVVEHGSEVVTRRDYSGTVYDLAKAVFQLGLLTNT
jgi:hypothetical protein